jgi:dihydroorotase
MDVAVRNGRIEKLGHGLSGDGADVFDASGMLVMPGFIDLHTHLREPGGEEAETIASGCEAAAWGGYTAICPMPNTDPGTDDAGRIKFVLDRATGAPVRVYPIGAITRGRRGEELAEMFEMTKAGAAGFSDDGCSVMNARIMANALRYAAMVGKPLILHEEDPNLDRDGQMNEGALSAILGLQGMPGISEEVMVLRDIALAEYLGAGLHITHISSKGTVDIIRKAKDRGMRITCDVTPHHLTLTEERVAAFDTRFKMNPPLRTEADMRALREGLADGTVDVIATDHAPHYPENKEVEFIYAAFGVTGLETAVAVIDRELIRTGAISWNDAVRFFSQAPARILGVPGGTLAPGSAADITIYNPDLPWTVDVARMRSKSVNTPYSGWDLPGRAAAIVVDGRLRLNH